MRQDPAVEKEVLDVLNGIAEAYGKKDEGSMMAKFAADPDLISVGTGIDEWRIGWDALKSGVERDFAQAREVSMSVSRNIVRTTGDIAWFAAEMDVRINTGDSETSAPARYTGVLERRDNKWLIVQSHFSLPASGQAEGRSYPEE